MILNFVLVGSKKGYYGQIYDRLDGQIIFLWLNTYTENRFNIAEEQSYRNHLETKQSFLNTSERLKEESHKRELEAFKLKYNEHK